MNESLRRALRRGGCPGALRPMPARDGLLVRLRITGGILPSGTAHALAGLAERYGNGLLDLSARANLQLRGMRPDTLPALWKELTALGLLDAHAGDEAVRNVLASPMAGLRSSVRPDIRPLTAGLETALVNDRALRAMPRKFGFLVDDGGEPSLAAVRADLRFDWTDDGFAVGLGGTAVDALDLGHVASNAVIDRALAIAHRLLAFPGGSERPHRLMDSQGRGRVAAWFDARDPALSDRRIDAPQVVGTRTFDGVETLGAAAPFGRLDAAMLRAAARASAGELRLTPWRTLLLPRARKNDILAAEGFVLDAADPRLRIAACAGVDGCARGTTDTHFDASRLAPFVATLPGDGIALHVSGCIKGCAHPAPAPVTLTAREGRYDLILNGGPQAPPEELGLTGEEIETVCCRTSRRDDRSSRPSRTRASR